MSEPFLITGLPRSRTAWLSVAAANDQSICWHEPVGWLDRWQDVFTKIWGNQPQRYVGASDSALGFHLQEIIERVAPRVLIVERDIGQVQASLDRLGPTPVNFCTLLKASMEYIHPLIKRVPFEALADSHVVVQCLRHLMPEAVISQDRIRALQPLNIQADMTRVHQSIAVRARDMSAVLGPDVFDRLRAV